MLKGKCCIVTGGAQGLGKAIAESLLKQNARVFLADINEGELRNTHREFSELYGQDVIYFRKCDVTKDLEDTFKEALKLFGRLDIVANNAGILDEFDLDLCVNINLLAVMKGTRLAIEYMKKDGGGGIIIYTSSIGGLKYSPQVPAYSGTKAGIIGYTSALAKFPDSVTSNIRMNCLCPDAMSTYMSNVSVLNKSLETPETMREYMGTITKMTPEYVAGGFMEIVKNTEMNGECMEVTLKGGYNILKPILY